MMTVERFADCCRALPYRDKGMFYSEVYLFLEACDQQGVDLIIESGVKNGMSTALLSSAWPGEIISIDKERLSIEPVARVEFCLGDSRIVIPAVLSESAGRRVAVLIDGPKGAEAVALKDGIWPVPEVRVVAIHDVPLAGAAGASRHSQAKEYRRQAGTSLDWLIKHRYRDKYPDGPGLAIWEKKL
jgi:predicted O-methyltransferase YrrM